MKTKTILRAFVAACVLMTAGAAFVCAKPGRRATATKTPTPVPEPTEEPEEVMVVERAPRWIPPPPCYDEGRQIRYTAHFGYLDDVLAAGRVLSMFDLAARRNLDENFVSAEGVVRFQKKLSSSDDVEALQLRTARVSYVSPWLQVNAGRFDLLPFVTPHVFFGGLPVMGIHRVDGVLAVSSFFFRLGTEEERTQAASPFALGVFYTPSMFSASWASLDQTQGFMLGQVRLRARVTDTQLVFRANVAKTKADYFDYSSMSSQPAYSMSGELSYKRDCALTAEYGVQNIKKSSETGALALGVRFSRIVTRGIFSLDDIALEAQVPQSGSLENPFTGGNGLYPGEGQMPSKALYGRVKVRVGAAFIETHVTTNQDDYTFGRLTPRSLWLPPGAGFGPGRETEDSGVALRAASGDKPACLVRVGVIF